MATRLDAITTGYMLATGKSTLPAVGNSKRDLLTNLAIKFYRDWQTEPGIEWDSLYDVIGAGTVTATDTFDLDTEINFISQDEQREDNFVRVLCTDGTTYINFKAVKPGQLYQYRYEYAVAKISDNRIKFSRAFIASDRAFGGAIQVPAITKLDDLDEDTSEILIDDAEWLGVRIAAQYAYSFKSLRDMYPDLLDQANEKMTGMMGRNTSGDESTSTGVDYFATMGNVGIDC